VPLALIALSVVADLVPRAGEFVGSELATGPACGSPFAAAAAKNQ
jgi:hypothetical protein